MVLTGSLEVVTEGETVGFEFTVTNTGENPIETRFRDGQPAEFVVLADGAEVWRWSDGRMFTQALWSETLEPGESVTYDARWDPPEPGSYEAVANLEAIGTDLEVRAPFEV